jgi:hypothetical protein
LAGLDGVVEPSADGMQQRQLAQAVELHVVELGPQRGGPTCSQVGFGGVQIPAPKPGGAEAGQRDRPCFGGKGSRAGAPLELPMRLQHSTAGGQNLVEVAGPTGPEQPADRQDQSEPGAPVIGQHFHLLLGQVLERRCSVVVGDDLLGGRQQRELREAHGVRRQPVQQICDHRFLAA